MIRRLLCAIGIHVWGAAYTRDLGTHVRVWKFCTRDGCNSIDADKRPYESS